MGDIKKSKKKFPEKQKLIRSKSQMWIHILILLVMVVLVTALRLHSMKEPLERDITSYAYISHQILEGEELYSYLWDHKPPGIYWIYILAEILWGYNQQAVTYLGIVFTIFSISFFYFFLIQISSSWMALIGASFWAIISNSILLQSNQPNVELFMNTFVILGLWTFTKGMKGINYFFLISGCSFAVATVLKTVAIFLIFFLALYFLLHFPIKQFKLWLKDQRKRLLYFLSPFLLSWAGIFIYFWIGGRFSSFWEAVFAYNISYSGNFFRNIWHFFSRPERMFPYCLKEVWILVLLSIAWFALSRRAYGPLRRSFFILLLSAVCLEIASPGHFFPHYYQLLLPVFCTFSVLFLQDLGNYLKIVVPKYRNILLGILILFVFVFILSFQIVNLRLSPEKTSRIKYGNEFINAYEVAQVVKQLSRPGEKIYEWGAETGIYFYSNRDCASGISCIYPLFFGSESERIKKKKRIFREVTQAMPILFIYNERYGKLEKNYFAPFLKERYNLLKRIDFYLIFKRMY